MANKQLQMVMRDMLFVTWAVRPERARTLVGKRLELDTLIDSTGRECAFASAVCFNVDEVRASVLPMGRISFGQVNYRVYVKADDVPAVCFLDMKVNSRTVTTLTSFLGIPIQHEEIKIDCAADASGSVRYNISSNGLSAEAIASHEPSTETEGKEDDPSPEFITSRFVGYVLSGDSMYKIEVEQPGLDSRRARVLSARSPRLEQLGLLDGEESIRPHSALYVREASFGANMPTRVS